MEEPVTKNEEVGLEDEVLESDAEAVEEVGAAHLADEDAAGGEGLEEPTDEPLADAVEEDVVDRDPDAPGGQDDRLNALRGEYDRLNDRHLRLQAEFNNFRRRSEQERLSAWSRAQADLVANFLDVLDDLHRVAELDLSNATVEAIMEGIDLVEKKFVRMLGEASVDMSDPTGQAFDPETMEAMMRVPAESDDQVDTVAQVFQKGYSLKGILVRPARVSVYTQG
jgi:molecular chaperone GrpE